MKTSSTKKDILQRLRKLNELIEEFIHSTLEQGETPDKPQSNIFLNETVINKRRCWEIKQCGESDCPCRTGEDYRCWLISGTLNKGCCQGIFAQKYKTCYECEVFNQFLDTPENTLYENVNILITHLVDKNQKERELAFKDGLTGLYNRNFLNLIEKGDVLNLNHKSFPLSIIIFDLDMLKAVNDTYGHIMGDKLIRELSTFLLKNKREPDLLFRLGGDEFMLLMSGVDEKRRALTEKRLIELSGIWNQKRKKSIPVPLSFSLGGATGFWGKKINQIIIEADKKMYIHKQSKRGESFSNDK
ncbi:MAG: GGDEF domain-containing protein [Desulfosalsimonadaceae bacterium]|nr:GGDEF domain-containing protein [Desulfosalsimonadaceae bacterium]